MAINGTIPKLLDGFITTSTHDTENRALIFAVTRLRALCERIRTRFTLFRRLARIVAQHVTMVPKTPVLESDTHYRQEAGHAAEDTEQATIEIEPALTWAPAHRPASRPDWRTVDRALRAIGNTRARVDADDLEITSTRAQVVADLVRSSVPHYWILHPEERILLIHRWSDAGSIVVQRAAAGETIRAEPFDAIEIRVIELLGDDDDDDDAPP